MSINNNYSAPCRLLDIGSMSNPYMGVEGLSAVCVDPYPRGSGVEPLRMLQYLLKRTFTLTDVRDVPRLTTVHDRKITVDIMQCSEWKRHWVGEIF